MQIYGGYYIYITLTFPRCYKHEVFGNFSWFPENQVYPEKKSAMPDKMVYWRVPKDIEIKV